MAKILWYLISFGLFVITALAGAGVLTWVVADEFGWTYDQCLSLTIGVYILCILFKFWDAFDEGGRTEMKRSR